MSPIVCSYFISIFLMSNVLPRNKLRVFLLIMFNIQVLIMSILISRLENIIFIEALLSRLLSFGGF